MYTDHRAFRWLLNLQDRSSRLTRWAVKLSEYDYKVGHQLGTRMQHADALSRNVSRIEKDLNVSRLVICEQQVKDDVCVCCDVIIGLRLPSSYGQLAQGPQWSKHLEIPFDLCFKILSCLPAAASEGFLVSRRTA